MQLRFLENAQAKTAARTSRSALRGDTLIEVTFAMGIFAMVSLISIATMNSGISLAEADLEYETTREEIDSQAEALRFIQASYLSELELIKDNTIDQHTYTPLWKALTDQAIDPSAINNDESALAVSSCEVPYQNNYLPSHKAFVVNTRWVNPDDPNANTAVANTLIRSNLAADRDKFVQAALAPRLIFRKLSESTNSTAQGNLMTETTTTTNDNTSIYYKYYEYVSRVEGIWIIAVKQRTYNPEFYDFHIRSCWYAPGASAPSTIGTIIRLYNPDFQPQ